jgi:exodeoxyribonuclease VII large subunit
MKPLKAKLDGLEAQLKAYHPHGPLKRGYAIVTHKKTGKILRSPDDAKKGDRLMIEVQKGKLESEVVSPGKPEIQQESLF